MVQQLLEFSVRHLGLMIAAFAVLGVLASLEYLRRLFGSQAISPTLASLLINRQHASIVDIRSKIDFKSAHLPHARHATYEHLHTALHMLNPAHPILFITDKNEPALNIRKLCHHTGFNQLYHLDGGIEAWKNANLPLSYSLNRNEIN